MEKNVKPKKVSEKFFRVVERALNQSSNQAAKLAKQHKLPLIAERPKN
jgi:hypothetical protein